MVAPLAVDLTYTAVKYEDEAADDFRVDFSLHGYLHSSDDEDVGDNANAHNIVRISQSIHYGHVRGKLLILPLTSTYRSTERNSRANYLHRWRSC